MRPNNNFGPFIHFYFQLTRVEKSNRWRLKEKYKVLCNIQKNISGYFLFFDLLDNFFTRFCKF